MQAETPRADTCHLYCLLPVQDTEAVYLVQEYCEGGDLFKRMMMLGGRMEARYVCVEVSHAWPSCMLSMSYFVHHAAHVNVQAG